MTTSYKVYSYIKKSVYSLSLCATVLTVSKTTTNQLPSAEKFIKTNTGSLYIIQRGLFVVATIARPKYISVLLFILERKKGLRTHSYHYLIQVFFFHVLVLLFVFIYIFFVTMFFFILAFCCHSCAVNLFQGVKKYKKVFLFALYTNPSVLYFFVMFCFSGVYFGWYAFSWFCYISKLVSKTKEGLVSVSIMQRRSLSPFPYP